MRLTFYGAAHEVTGSCTLLEVDSYRILIDCGMFQGTPAIEAKNPTFDFDPKMITHVLVTHAHLDHVGRLPMLVKQGYQGMFYGTAPTLELAKLIMDDALGIMQYDNRRTGRPILYNESDIAVVMDQIKPVKYDEAMTLVANDFSVKATWRDAGHVFGSAFIELQVKDKKIVFSGDVGNINVPILRDTTALPTDADLIVSESTYGDRLHENAKNRDQVIEEMIRGALRPGGVVMIPSFSLERTHELLYELNELVDRRHRLPKVPIFLDSPLAIDALKVFLKYPEYYDPAAKDYVKLGDDLFNFPGLTMTYTRDESKKINQVPGTKIVIAGSGMMNGGRILHHALRYLSDANSSLLLIGFQSPGTLGRQLADGARSVEVLGEKVYVRCHVQMVGSLSAHADQAKLVSWIGTAHPKRVILNHGDFQAASALEGKLKAMGIETEVAGPGLSYEI